MGSRTFEELVAGLEGIDDGARHDGRAHGHLPSLDTLCVDIGLIQPHAAPICSWNIGCVAPMWAGRKATGVNVC